VFRAFFFRIERAALFVKVIEDCLFDCVVRIGIETRVLPGQKLNGPLINLLFSRELFVDSEFRKGTIELEGSN